MPSRDEPEALSVMLIAGEPSGDLLGAELVSALRECAMAAPVLAFGAGGPRMAAAGVELVIEMTRYSMIGLAEVLKNYRTFKRLFDQLLAMARDRRPTVIVCVDFPGFNRRFAQALRASLRKDPLGGWTPRIVQYVSPQVWASRPGRVRTMTRDLDLLLAIFPFERQWYAQHAPGLRVDFVGHPMVDRYGVPSQIAAAPVTGGPAGTLPAFARSPEIVLLPGSRKGELRRHLPVMVGAATLIRRDVPDAVFRLVTPDHELGALAREATASLPGLETQIGGLAEALARADLAIASTGTVTLECAYFGVPAVAIYKTSWFTYQLGKRIVTVPHLAMPNLLAHERLFPELIQDDAAPGRIAAAALALLGDASRRAHVKRRLADVVASLGAPGASRRAAEAILSIV